MIKLLQIFFCFQACEAFHSTYRGGLLPLQHSATPHTWDYAEPQLRYLSPWMCVWLATRK